VLYTSDLDVFGASVAVGSIDATVTPVTDGTTIDPLGH
jgi:hypothetical protein